METKKIYNNLIQSLKLIASPHHIQISCFPDYVNVTDEIALIYNESYIMLPQISSIMSPHIVKLLDELDELFEEMSRDKALWNINNLERNFYWTKSRDLGSRILVELKEKYTKPNLDFIQWVK